MKTKEKKPGAFMAIGLGSGIAIGAGVGAATENLPIGISLGVALGAAFGALLTKPAGGQGGSPTSTRSINDRSPNPAEELKAWQEEQKKPRQ
ncbi:MAG: hypothetical protein H0T73_10370 [Ardenticatenales bacterium]|nr:hypothetical protein [Ardenticatenales bacterium]